MFFSCLLWQMSRNLGDLANNALNLAGDVDEVPLGDGLVGVEDVVDAVNHLL